MDSLTKLFSRSSEVFLGGDADVAQVRNKPLYLYIRKKFSERQQDLLCLVVGEIQDQKKGTRLGAAGNRMDERKDSVR
jgi:hypothetical protein